MVLPVGKIRIIAFQYLTSASARLSFVVDIMWSGSRVSPKQLLQPQEKSASEVIHQQVKLLSAVYRLYTAKYQSLIFHGVMAEYVNKWQAGLD